MNTSALQDVDIALPAPTLARLALGARKLGTTRDTLIEQMIAFYIKEPACQLLPILPLLAPPAPTEKARFSSAVVAAAQSLHAANTPLHHIVARAVSFHLDQNDAIDGPLNHAVALPRASYDALAQDAARLGSTPDAMIRRLLGDYIFDTTTARLDITPPACDAPYTGACALGRGLTAQLSHVMRWHDRPNLRADGTLLIARAVQRHVDNLQPAPPAPPADPASISARRMAQARKLRL